MQPTLSLPTAAKAPAIPAGLLTPPPRTGAVGADFAMALQLSVPQSGLPQASNFAAFPQTLTQPKGTTVTLPIVDQAVDTPAGVRAAAMAGTAKAAFNMVAGGTEPTVAAAPADRQILAAAGTPLPQLPVAAPPSDRADTAPTAKTKRAERDVTGAATIVAGLAALAPAPVIAANHQPLIVRTATTRGSHVATVAATSAKGAQPTVAAAPLAAATDTAMPVAVVAKDYGAPIAKALSDAKDKLAQAMAAMTKPAVQSSAKTVTQKPSDPQSATISGRATVPAAPAVTGKPVVAPSVPEQVTVPIIADTAIKASPPVAAAAIAPKPVDPAAAIISGMATASAVPQGASVPVGAPTVSGPVVAPVAAHAAIKAVPVAMASVPVSNVTPRDNAAIRAVASPVTAGAASPAGATIIAGAVVPDRNATPIVPPDATIATAMPVAVAAAVQPARAASVRTPTGQSQVATAPAAPNIAQATQTASAAPITPTHIASAAAPDMGPPAEASIATPPTQPIATATPHAAAAVTASGRPVTAAVAQPAAPPAQAATAAAAPQPVVAQATAAPAFAMLAGQAMPQPMRIAAPRDGKADGQIAAVLAAVGSAAAQGPAAVAPTAQGDQTALDLRGDQGLQKMIDRIETLRNADGTQDARIRLMPAALGKVDITVRQDADKVHVHFAAQSHAAATLIADQAPRLTELADQRGLRLGQTTVDSGSAGTGQGQANQQQAGQQQRVRPASAFASASIGAEEFSDQRIA